MKTRAIVITCAHGCEGRRGAPRCLDLLVDRPFIEHVAEQLAIGGIQDVEVLVTGAALELETVLLGGERWGLSIRYRVPRSEDSTYELLTALHPPPGDNVLLVHADALVPASVWSASARARRPVELYTDGGGEWTGWCRLSARALAQIGRVVTRGELFAALSSAAGDQAPVACDAISIRDSRRLLEANARVLGGRAPFIAVHGRRGPDGVWRERGVFVHARASIEPPVYLAEHVQVGSDARIGPNLVVGARSIVDAGAHARESLITGDTYVAPDARCERVVGLAGRGYWQASGEPVAAALASALVDLRSQSILAALLLAAWRGVARVVTALLAPFWGRTAVVIPRAVAADEPEDMLTV